MRKKYASIVLHDCHIMWNSMVNIRSKGPTPSILHWCSMVMGYHHKQGFKEIKLVQILWSTTNPSRIQFLDGNSKAKPMEPIRDRIFQFIDQTFDEYGECRKLANRHLTVSPCADGLLLYRKSFCSANSHLDRRTHHLFGDR
jgi:hypothetical protein